MAMPSFGGSKSEKKYATLLGISDVKQLVVPVTTSTDYVL